MPLELNDVNLKRLKDSNQLKFNEMIIAGNLLAEHLLRHEFNPLLTASLSDFQTGDEWQLFLDSNYYALYEDFFSPISIYGLNDSGKAFKLFTSAFKYADKDDKKITFDASRLVLLLNEKIGASINGLSFEFIDFDVLMKTTIDEESVLAPPNSPIDDFEVELLEKKELILAINIDEKSSVTPQNSPVGTSELSVSNCLDTIAETSSQSDLLEQKLINSSKKENAPFLSGLSMHVLSGFLTVVGISAIAIAFVVLNASSAVPGLIVAGLGLTAILAGVGLFASGMNDDDNDAEELASNNVTESF